MTVLSVARVMDATGRVTYHFLADPSWEGFESLVDYMKKYWSAIVTQSSDEVYTRTWEIRANGVSIRVRHDSQAGNSFFRASDGDDTLLDAMYTDLKKRLA